MQNKSGFLLIADISGYTPFIKNHSMRKKPIIGKKIADFWDSHAHKLINTLLEEVIQNFEPVMQFNKLEGDAALFFLEEISDKNQMQDIYEKMVITRERFNSKVNSLQFVQSCPCDPCQQSKNLKLKMFLHKGYFNQTEIRNNQELSGEALIFIHRLLKNKVKSSEYFLFSGAVLEQLDKGLEFSLITQKIDDFGKQKLGFIDFEGKSDTVVGNRFARRVLDTYRMLSFFIKK
tara:strand:+ start:201 stop:899 length:699 start_codon:yes stop_codon:yes gene_type:complete